VQGTYKELVPFSRLRLDWRFANWPDDATSKVRCQVVCSVCCSIALASSFWLENISRIAEYMLAVFCGTCQPVPIPYTLAISVSTSCMICIFNRNQYFEQLQMCALLQACDAAVHCMITNHDHCR